MEARLTRGDIWAAAGGPAGKPRPFVIVHDDRLRITTSATVCGLTSDPAELSLFRVAVTPSDLNQLEFPSHIMVDKITTIARSKLGYRIGRLDEADLIRLNQALKTYLGLGGKPA